jgi:3-oxoacyl-[acyl-carrier-protein] synthase-3
MRTEVFVTRTGVFLPFAPVGNADIEDVLGRVGGKPSRARLLRYSGIRSLHYAIDRATGEPATTNAQLTPTRSTR